MIANRLARLSHFCFSAGVLPSLMARRSPGAVVDVATEDAREGALEAVGAEWTVPVDAPDRLDEK